MNVNFEYYSEIRQSRSLWILQEKLIIEFENYSISQTMSRFVDTEKLKKDFLKLGKSQFE
jgi:hypothetical protein